MPAGLVEDFDKKSVRHRDLMSMSDEGNVVSVMRTYRKSLCALESVEKKIKYR